ncbi:MAG: hypothetical protein MK010_09735 [Erythrobacter sp.]|nr:hypothetical protein [Erythrobacter sp.]
MGPRRAKMLEDKRLRDAARALVDADIENLKSDLATRSAGGRIADRLAEGASDVYDEALDVAKDHKGALAAIGAAAILWFARNPVLTALFGDEWADEHLSDDEEDEFDFAYSERFHR